jgi:hypothetical protein
VIPPMLDTLNWCGSAWTSPRLHMKNCPTFRLCHAVRPRNGFLACASPASRKVSAWAYSDLADPYMEQRRSGDS